MIDPGAAMAELALGTSPNVRVSALGGDRRLTVDLSLLKKIGGKSQAVRAMQFLSELRVPEGKKAGKPLKLADFQRRFVKGALARDVMVGVLSIGRGNGKTGLAAGLALAELVGALEEHPQPKREIILAARNRDQAKTAFGFLVGFIEGLPEPDRALFTIRRGSKLEVEVEGNGGGLARVVAADGKSILGGAPTLAILDERAAWEREKGDSLENAILSGLGKRGGRVLIISTSAPDDANTFSRWLDEPPPGTYVQEHRPPFGLPADDLESLLIANPGAKEGIGATPDWLVAQARRAIARGGSALASFRNLNRNERCSTEDRSVLVTVRAALVAEDTERREAGADLETRAGKEWDDLVAGFELRQVALALDEGRALTGRTLEVVTEMRGRGGYRGMPVPLAVLERRNTVASGTPNPVETRPIIDRLFPESMAARMGGQMIAIDSGAVEWPVTTSAVTAGWQATEGGAVPGPTAYTTVDKALAPNNTLGIRMAISRKALLQSGQALEDAIRRDMSGTMQAELDKAIFLGTGASGQPLGVIAGAGTYGITSTAVGAIATWAAFRAAIVRFMNANTPGSTTEIRVLMRPETWDVLDAQVTPTTHTEFERMMSQLTLGNIWMSANALAAPAGSPLACSALLATAAGVAPFFVGMWGGVDLIRDPFSDAASGGLRLTALVTADVTVARSKQLQLLTGLRLA